MKSNIKSENPLQNPYPLQKQKENLEANSQRQPTTGEQVRRNAFLLKIGFTEENKLLSMEELESKAVDLNFKFEEQVARKAATMKLLEESGAKHVQKAGAFLTTISQKQREAMQKKNK